MDQLEDIFFEVFEALPRQGPGNFESTARAFALCDELPDSPDIIDLGCGVGGQTLHLAELSNGPIVAIDSRETNIVRLRREVNERSLSERIAPQTRDMLTLDQREQCDLIWSEGAFYNIGLQAALDLARRLLRPHGYLAFTDAVWRTDEPHPDVRTLFADYPGMGSVHDILERLVGNDWSVVGHFPLPDNAWWDDFYTPMELRIDELRKTYTGNADALKVLDEIAKEPNFHREYGGQYGYEFFIAQKPSDGIRF